MQSYVIAFSQKYLGNDGFATSSKSFSTTRNVLFGTTMLTVTIQRNSEDAICTWCLKQVKEFAEQINSCLMTITIEVSNNTLTATVDTLHHKQYAALMRSLGTSTSLREYIWVPDQTTWYSPCYNCTSTHRPNTEPLMTHITKLQSTIQATTNLGPSFIVLYPHVNVDYASGKVYCSIYKSV